MNLIDDLLSKVIESFIKNCLYKKEKKVWFSYNRIKKEKYVVYNLISFYCICHSHKNKLLNFISLNQNQNSNNVEKRLCPSCNKLIRYAFKRLNYCPFSLNKTTCSKCTIHCYAPQMKVQIKKVMKWSGPKIFLLRPDISFWHLIVSFKKKCKTSL